MAPRQSNHPYDDRDAYEDDESDTQELEYLRPYLMHHLHEDFDHPRYFEVPYDPQTGRYLEPHEIEYYGGNFAFNEGPITQGCIVEGGIGNHTNTNINVQNGNSSALWMLTGAATATASLVGWRSYKKGELHLDAC